MLYIHSVYNESFAGRAPKAVLWNEGKALVPGKTGRIGGAGSLEARDPKREEDR